MPADRQQLVQAVADRFDVTDDLAGKAVQSALLGTDRGKGKAKETEQLSPDEWDRATAWIFEERMAVIGVVALFLRIRESPSCIKPRELHH